MADVSVRTTDSVLKFLGVLVLLLGVVIAVISICVGFDVVEPWSLNGILVDEEWQSVTLGFLGTAYALIYAGVVWGFIQVGRSVLVRHAHHVLD